MLWTDVVLLITSLIFRVWYQVLSTSPKYLILLITLPAIIFPGVYTSSLAPARPSGLYLSEPTFFNITVGPPRPEIILISPSQAGSSGGNTVSLFVGGFLQPMERAATSVSFGALTARLLSDPLPDGLGGASLSVQVPSGSSVSTVTIVCNYTISSDPTLFIILTASTTFLFVSDLVNLVCPNR